MKIKLKCSGTDGRAHYQPGDVCDTDSEWARRMLINGKAEPIDEVAQKIADSPYQRERYYSPGLAGDVGKTTIVKSRKR